jgi:hypothetical protein
LDAVPEFAPSDPLECGDLSPLLISGVRFSAIGMEDKNQSRLRLQVKSKEMVRDADGA